MEIIFVPVFSDFKARVREKEDGAWVEGGGGGGWRGCYIRFIDNFQFKST